MFGICSYLKISMNSFILFTRGIIFNLFIEIILFLEGLH